MTYLKTKTVSDQTVCTNLINDLIDLKMDIIIFKRCGIWGDSMSKIATLLCDKITFIMCYIAPVGIKFVRDFKCKRFSINYENIEITDSGGWVNSGSWSQKNYECMSQFTGDELSFRLWSNISFAGLAPFKGTLRLKTCEFSGSASLLLDIGLLQCDMLVISCPYIEDNLIRGLILFKGNYLTIAPLCSFGYSIPADEIALVLDLLKTVTTHNVNITINTGQFKLINDHFIGLRNSKRALLEVSLSNLPNALVDIIFLFSALERKIENSNTTISNVSSNTTKNI
jgi:hypothetical protein